MDATDAGQCDERSIGTRSRRYLPRFRAVLVQSEMRSICVVVPDVLAQQPGQMVLAEDDEGDEDIRAARCDEFGDDEEGGGAKQRLPEKKRKRLLDPKTWERDSRLVEVATKLPGTLGDTLFEDHNRFRDRVDSALKKADIKLAAADRRQILKALSWRVEAAPPGIAKVTRLRGLLEATVDGKPAVVEYEPDSDLHDTEQVPLIEDGGIEAFIRRKVRPYTSDAWIKADGTKIGCEVCFTRYSYKPQPLRTLDETSAGILTIEKEAEGPLDGLLKVGAKA